MAKILEHYNPEIRVSFDVDETLVRFEGKNLIRHEKHIEAIKRHYYRGHHVRVHSAGGGDWAKLVVKLLGLEEFVHEAVAKDSWYVDDLAADAWMERYYIPEEGFNGRAIGKIKEDSRDSETSSDLFSVTHNGLGVVYPVPAFQSTGVTSGGPTDQSGDRTGWFIGKESRGSE